MKFLSLAIFLFSCAFADMNTPVLPAKSYRYDKVMICGHNYMMVTENSIGAQTQVKHDPDCRCRKFTEEQIAKVVQEVLRLKDLEFKELLQEGTKSLHGKEEKAKNDTR